MIVRERMFRASTIALGISLALAALLGYWSVAVRGTEDVGPHTLVMRDGVLVALPAGFDMNQLSPYRPGADPPSDEIVISRGPFATADSYVSWDYARKPPTVIEWHAAKDDEAVFREIEKQLNGPPNPDILTQAPGEGEIRQTLPEADRPPAPVETQKPLSPEEDPWAVVDKPRTLDTPVGAVTVPAGYTYSFVIADFPDGTSRRQFSIANGEISGDEPVKSQIWWDADTGEVLYERVAPADSADFDQLKTELAILFAEASE